MKIYAFNPQRMFRRIFSKNGFSLVEAMVTVLIFTFISAGLYSFMAVSETSFRVNNEKVKLQQEIRKAMEWMKYDLQQAGASSIVDVPDDGNPYTTITFKIPTGVTSGAIDWTTDSIQYVLGGSDGTDLNRIIGTTTKLLAQNIKSVEFLRQSVSSDILEVSLEGEKDVQGRDIINYDLDFQIQLRN